MHYLVSTLTFQLFSSKALHSLNQALVPSIRAERMIVLKYDMFCRNNRFKVKARKTVNDRNKRYKIEID